MIGLPAVKRISRAAVVTDLPAGMNGLTANVDAALVEHAYCGEVFVSCGRHGGMLKVLWWSGDGLIC